MNAITENFSKKRGRKASPMSQVMAGLYPDDGKRSRNNKAYLTYAIAALGYKPGQPNAYAWLLETTPAHRWKRGTLLSEIGRLADPELIKSVAASMCKRKPRVKDGIMMIRSFRMRLRGKQEPAPDALKLSNEIIHTINDYALRFPEVTGEQILTALYTATEQVEHSFH